MARNWLWWSLLGIAVLGGCAGTQPAARDDAPLLDNSGLDEDPLRETRIEQIVMLRDLRDAMYPPVSDAELLERAFLDCIGCDRAAVRRLHSFYVTERAAGIRSINREIQRLVSEDE